MEECLCIMQVHTRLKIIPEEQLEIYYTRLYYEIMKFSMINFELITAAEMSDTIASIAPISGSPFLGFDNLPNSPISVIDFHGTDDDTIPYDANRYYMSQLITNMDFIRASQIEIVEQTITFM